MKKIYFILIPVIIFFSYCKEETNYAQIKPLFVDFKMVLNEETEISEKVKILEDSKSFIFVDQHSLFTNEDILEFSVNYDRNIIIVKFKDDAVREFKQIIRDVNDREMCVLLDGELSGFIKIKDLRINFNKIILPICDLSQEKIECFSDK